MKWLRKSNKYDSSQRIINFVKFYQAPKIAEYVMRNSNQNPLAKRHTFKWVNNSKPDLELLNARLRIAYDISVVEKSAEIQKHFSEKSQLEPKRPQSATLVQELIYVR